MLVAATACLLGFANGMRHAFEPDHLAAVSTLVAGERSARASVRYAAAWGAGHAVMLVVAGGALALVREELPESIGEVLELVVAVVLVALGVRALRAAAASRTSGGSVAPSADLGGHAHGHRHAESRWALARLPFCVGLVHGLAGSGALTALVASHASAPVALAIITVYGVGAMVGMAALAGVLGWPLARLARAPGALPLLVGASGVVSLVVGVLWGAPIIARVVT